MKINTKTWFDGEHICKKGEPYEGKREKGHFEEVTPNEETKEKPLLKLIKKALMEIDHEDNKLWTNAGLPQVKEIEKMVGQTVSRDQINDAFPGFQRDVKPLGDEKPILPAAQ
jgi:alpha-acetolactate decarboxylase